MKDLDNLKIFDALSKVAKLAKSDVSALRSLSNADRTAPLDVAEGSVFVLQSDAENYATDSRSREQQVDAIADLAQEQASSITRVAADTTGTFDTFSKLYVSADAGFAYAPGVRKIVPYLGTNIYLRPVNKDALLRDRGGFRRRFAITLALTLSSIADDNKTTRDDLFGAQSLLLGGGFRLTDTIRIGAGALAF